MSEQPGTSVEPAYAAAMPAPQGGALPTGLEWQALERMASTLADSDVIPYRLKRKPADIAVILLAAREYGIPPLMALSKLPVVNGTPAPMGELMVALVLRAGHSIRVTIEGEGGPWQDMAAVCTTKRRGEDEPDVLRFTFREAVDADLVALINGKPQARDTKGQPTPWELYTVNMLRWRAVANACRLRFPDVLLGLSYLPEELGAVVDAEGAPIMGTVVENAPRQRATSTSSLEQRSAQEAADKLATFVGPLEVLDKVLEHAESNGYAGETVAYAGNPMTLRGAIALRKADLADNTHQGETVEEPQAPQEAQEAPEEPPAPAPAPEEPVEAPTAPQEPTEAPAPDPSADPIELARAVLEERDDNALRELYGMATRAGVLDVNVISVIGDDDLDAIDMQGTVSMPLGALLHAAHGYVIRHNAAIRDLGE